MRTLLPKKEKHYKEFADVINRTYRQMRYGINSCRPGLDADLIDMRKQIVDWQAIEDEGALCQTNINYTTWLPISYRNDTSVQYDRSSDVWGPGYYKSSSADAPQQVGVGYTYGNGTQNIIEVNTWEPEIIESNVTVGESTTTTTTDGVKRLVYKKNDE